MKFVKIHKGIICVIFFALIFYWVEFSSWGSHGVAKYNNGYGTFDMKQFTVDDVEHVLGEMEPEGFHAYYRYLIGDFLFILALGALQLYVTSRLKVANKSTMIYKGSVVIVLLRGLFDFIENCMLVYTLVSYPKINNTIVGMNGVVTQLKLTCIGLWIVSIVILGFMKIKAKREGNH